MPRLTQHVVSETATCQDCGWRCDESQAVTIASRHAHLTGHHITGQRVTAFQWNAPLDTPDTTERKE